MASYRMTFKCTIMTPDRLIYEKDVQSLFLTGDHGEYELLPYHYPVLGILQKGSIIIDWRESVDVISGILRFFANDCIVLVEQEEQKMAKAKAVDDDIVLGEEKE